jgi:hypothetical protein
MDLSEWFSQKPALKEKNPLMNLPYVIHGDRVITQSNACFSYLGRQLGLWGKTEDEVTDCEQLLCEIMDIRNNAVKFAYGGGECNCATAADCLKSMGNQHCARNLKYYFFPCWHSSMYGVQHDD